MSTAILSARGSKIVTADEVFAVPAPAPTVTWFPVPHGRVLETARNTLANAGFNITREQLALGGDGAKFFATFDLASGLANGVTVSAGIRSSIDQTLTFGFCAGSRVFVCDNLSFTSELVVSRKHTKFGSERYQEAMSLAVQKLGQFQITEHERIQDRVKTVIGSERADSIILQAYKAGIVSHIQLPKIIEQWETPKFQEFQPRTLWSLWNAFTWALAPVAQSSPQRFAAATIKLQSIFDPSRKLPAAGCAAGYRRDAGTGAGGLGVSFRESGRHGGRHFFEVVSQWPKLPNSDRFPSEE